MKDKELRKLIDEITNIKNTINCAKEDIYRILSLGDEYCSKPKVNVLAKGGILFIKANKQLGFGDIDKLSLEFLKNCDGDANTIWSMNVDEKRKRNKLVTLFVYGGKND